MELLTASLLNGFIYGAFLLVSALGLSLVFGLGRVANFAHGAFYALGGYAAMELGRRAGLGFWPSLALAPLFVVPVAVAAERLVIAPLRRRPEEHALLGTFGLSFMILGAIEAVWGTGTQILQLPSALTGSLPLLGITYPVYRIVAASLCLAIAGSVFLLVLTTRTGLQVRAVTADADMAEAIGVDTAALLRRVFAAAAALAGLAGAIGAPVFAVHPEMGTAFLLDSFLAVILGGLGYLPGCIAGAFLVAFVKALGGAYVADWSVAVLFAVVAVVLVVRPTGLFGRGRVA